MTLGILKTFIILGETKNSQRSSNASNDLGKNNDSVQAVAKTEEIKPEEADNNIGGYIYEGEDYNNYANSRYGFSIDFPKGFKICQPPENGDGLKFLSKDEKSSLVVYGENNIDEKTIQDRYRDQVNYIKQSSSISYQKLKDNWFVISWINNNQVYYSNSFIGEGSINSFIFECPEYQIDNYKEQIEHISYSFKAGNISEPN